jgi:predicted restriction endonuclease
MASPEQWLGKLAHLKVDKARGDPAPHKPLLLLVVLELAEQGPSFGDILALTPELAFRFCTYWSIVAHRRTQAPDVRACTTAKAAIEFASLPGEFAMQGAAAP